MCVILILEPGITPSMELIKNATYNNPDGYGLILKDTEQKKLQIIKSKAINGNIPENDPQVIYELLKDNEDCQRFLHLRHRTEGPVDEENTHPFTSFYSDKRQVYFMHNGTLHEYKPRVSHYTYVNNVRVNNSNDEDSISDSKKFNDTVLSPLLTKIKGANGYGDIHDDLVQAAITKFWGNNGDNKGLLISNNQDFILINKDKWKKINSYGVEFLASNDTYFDKVIRGPEFERRKKEEEAKRPRFQNYQHNTSYNTWSISSLKNVDLDEAIKLKGNLPEFFNSSESWDEDAIANLANVTEPEFITFCEKHPGDAASMLIILTSYYKSIFERYGRIVNHVASLNKAGKLTTTVSEMEKAA